jgi:hypothetical protein
MWYFLAAIPGPPPRPVAADHPEIDRHIETGAVLGQHPALAIQDSAPDGLNPLAVDQLGLGILPKLSSLRQRQPAQLAHQGHAGEDHGREKQGQPTVKHAGTGRRIGHRSEDPP